MASLVDYAISDNQREAVAAYERHGTLGGAAKEIGVARTTLKGSHFKKSLSIHFGLGRA